MGSIGRYIFRTTFGAFLLVLVSLTSAIWITQALRDVDLMTGQMRPLVIGEMVEAIGYPAVNGFEWHLESAVFRELNRLSDGPSVFSDAPSWSVLAGSSRESVGGKHPAKVENGQDGDPRNASSEEAHN